MAWAFPTWLQNVALLVQLSPFCPARKTSYLSSSVGFLVNCTMFPLLLLQTLPQLAQFYGADGWRKLQLSHELFGLLSPLLPKELIIVDVVRNKNPIFSLLPKGFKVDSRPVRITSGGIGALSFFEKPRPLGGQKTLNSFPSRRRQQRRRVSLGRLSAPAHFVLAFALPVGNSGQFISRLDSLPYPGPPAYKCLPNWICRPSICLCPHYLCRQRSPIRFTGEWARAAPMQLLLERKWRKIAFSAFIEAIFSRFETSERTGRGALRRPMGVRMEIP